MKKLVIASLVLTSVASTPALANNKGGRTWDLCGTQFPGLGFWWFCIFLLPCRVSDTVAARMVC
jgi:hypothetical protein